MGITAEKVTPEPGGRMVLIESSRAEAFGTERLPVLLQTGRPATGEFTCVECGYGVSVRSLLPVCPMCRGLVWAPQASGSQGRSAF